MASLIESPLYRRKSKSESGGRWITIGGKKGENGKRRGGSPVYIVNGRITRGHPSLTGKKIDALGEKAEGSSVRTANKQEKEYDRAKIAKEARKQGIHPKHLHSLAAEIKAHHDASGDDVRKMLHEIKRDYPHLKATVLSAERGGDSAGIKKLDTISQSMAHRPEFTHLFGGHADWGGVEEDHSEKLYDYLVAGAPEKMSEADAYEQAFDHLRRHKPKKREHADVGDFAFGANKSLFDESKIKRDEGGRFAEKEHVHEARRKLARGELKVTTGAATSSATGREIKRYIELANGAKIHPDELHRTRFDEKGSPYVSTNEKLTVIDGAGRREVSSFATAIRHAAMSKGQVTIAGPHGYSVTLPGSEWKGAEASGKTFAEWADEQDKDELAKKDAATTPLTEVVSGKAADDFFSVRSAGQSRLFSLSSSPLYIRKSAQFDENKHARDAGKFSSHQGAGAAPKQPAATQSPAAPAAPDAKTQGYVAQLKERFGDQAAAKVAEMVQKLRATPGSESKVAALEQIRTALGGNSGTPSESSPDPVAKLKELHDAAITDAHDPQAVKATLAEMSASMSTSQLKDAAKQFGINNMGSTKPEITDAIARKINGRREMLKRTEHGLPSPLKGKEAAAPAKGFEDDVMTSFLNPGKAVELNANPGIRKIARMVQASDDGSVRGLIDKNGSVVWDGSSALHQDARDHFNRPNAIAFQVNKTAENQYEVAFHGPMHDPVPAKNYLDSKLFKDAEPKVLNPHTLLISIKSLGEDGVRKGLGASPLYSR